MFLALLKEIIVDTSDIELMAQEQRRRAAGALGPLDRSFPHQLRVHQLGVQEHRGRSSCQRSVHRSHLHGFLRRG